MDVDFDPSFLSTLASSPSTPAPLRPYYERFQSLYDKRLWYQLTLAIDEFLALPEASPQAQIDLYEKFIVQFEKKINQLSRAAIAVKVARQHQSKCGRD
jgi:26S proteasome regulatory subunit N9